MFDEKLIIQIRNINILIIKHDLSHSMSRSDKVLMLTFVFICRTWVQGNRWDGIRLCHHQGKGAGTSSSTQRAVFEIVPHFTSFGLKRILNYFKPDKYLYLSNGFILNLPARNTEDIVPVTLHKFASRIKHWYT